MIRIGEYWLVDVLGNTLGIVFFGALTLLSAAQLLITGNPLSFGLALYNALLALTLAVRDAPARAGTGRGMILGLAGTLLPFVSIVERAPDGPLASLGAVVQATALVWVIASVAALGKSFGVAPADRGLVVTGPYHIVRHPLYLGELAFYAGVCIARPSILSVTLWIALACLQLARLRAEEGAIHGYEEYAQAVPWKLVPGIY